MSCIGPGKMVGLVVGGEGSERLEWYDLDCDEHWGDIMCGGGDRDAPWAKVGNDEDGYREVSAAYEDTPDGPAWIPLAKLRELVDARAEAFSA